MKCLIHKFKYKNQLKYLTFKYQKINLPCLMIILKRKYIVSTYITLNLNFFQNVWQYETMCPMPRSDPGLGAGDASQRLGVPCPLLLMCRLRGSADQGRSLRDEGWCSALSIALRDGRGAAPVSESSSSGLSTRSALSRSTVPLAGIPSPPSSSSLPSVSSASLDASSASPQPRKPGTASAFDAIHTRRRLTTQGTVLQWRRRRAAAKTEG